jgi:hypothetical protein
MKIEKEKSKTFGDSDFLAINDTAIRNFRSSENDAKRNIVKKMLTLRHNMKYNKHLLSVYVKAKELFDKMVDEHRSQLHSLDEIYRHLNQLIRENITKKRIHSKNSMSSEMMAELVKDKKRIGGLVKKMRNSYDKLMNVDTIIGVTVDKINEITFMDDDKNENETKEDDDDEEDDVDDDDDDESYEEEPDEENDDDDDDSEEEEEDDNDEDDEGDSDEEEEDDDSDDEEEDEGDDDDDDDSEEEEEEDDDEEESEEQEEKEEEEDEDDDDDEDDDEDNDDEIDNRYNSEVSNDPNRLIYVF